MLWLFAVLASCSVHRAGEQAVDVARQYRVTVSAQFGAVKTEESVLQPAMETRLALRVTSTPTRRFRDGSLGAQLRVVDAELTVDGEPVPVELVGRTAELRTFANGEILDIGWIDRLSGPGRHLDAFEVIFPALSPAPPSVKVGVEENRRIIWPFRSGRTVRWDNAVEAVWKNLGVDKALTSPAWELTYRGPWTLDGGTRFVSPGVGYTAKGHGEGTVWMDVKTGSMTLHVFEWHRTVQVEGKVALTQTQEFEGRIEVIP